MTKEEELFKALSQKSKLDTLVADAALHTAVAMCMTAASTACEKLSADLAAGKTTPADAMRSAGHLFALVCEKSRKKMENILNEARSMMDENKENEA